MCWLMGNVWDFFDSSCWIDGIALDLLVIEQLMSSCLFCVLQSSITDQRSGGDNRWNPAGGS